MAFLLALALAASDGSTREQRPLTVSFAATLAMPSAGVDVSYQLADRFAVGLQLTTLVVHYDASLRTRFFVVAGARSGLYLGANAHWWYSPLILTRPTWAWTGELGYELRDAQGFTFAIGIGAGRIADPSDGWQVLPLCNLRIGRSF